MLDALVPISVIPVKTSNVEHSASRRRRPAARMCRDPPAPAFLDLLVPEHEIAHAHIAVILEEPGHPTLDRGIEGRLDSVRGTPDLRLHDLPVAHHDPPV